MYLLGGLHRSLYRGGCLIALNFQLLHHSVDDIRLLHILLLGGLKFLHDGNDHHGESLILVEGDLDLSGWLLDGLGWCLGDLLSGLGLSLFVELSVDLLLDVLKLDVVLLDVDVGVSEESADLLHVGWSHPVVAVGSSHGLRESDQGLQLSHGDLVGSLVLGLLSLSDGLVLFFEDLS